MQCSMLALVLVFSFGSLLCGQSGFDTSTATVSKSSVSPTLPTVVSFSGSVRELDGATPLGPRNITFALYDHQALGTSLWSEAQTVYPDSQGRFTVLLGAGSVLGVPATVFAAGEPHWVNPPNVNAFSSIAVAALGLAPGIARSTLPAIEDNGTDSKIRDFAPALSPTSGTSFGSLIKIDDNIAWPVPAQTQSESDQLSSIRESAGAHYAREEPVSGRPIPTPFLYLGPSVMGGGYAAWAYRLEGGLNMEATHVVFRALGAYDDGRKLDDDDQPNPRGHDRYLDAGLYFRPARPGWTRMLYFGGGYTWSQLSTTNYTKGGGRYQLGGGYDVLTRACDACRRDYSMRINVDWITAGDDWQNGSHGPNTTLTWPSPREKRHWFYRQELGIYRFHESVTEPTNLSLTQLQRSQKSTDCFADFGILYRF
jgi:hypothetical protein